MDRKSQVEDAIQDALIKAADMPMDEKQQADFEKKMKMLRRLNAEA